MSSTDAEQLLTRLRASPEPALLLHSDAPAVLDAVHRALERACYIFGSDFP